MKQLKLLACFVMLTTFANAQYFQAKYAQDPNLGGHGINGMRTRATSDGHLLGGLMVVDQQPPPICPLSAFHWGLLVTRTDPAGGFTTPGNFNNTYLFQDASGNEIRLSGGQVLEYKDGSGYGAIFSYYLYIPPPPVPCGEPFLTSQGVAFVRLDAMGNVLTVSGFPMPGDGQHTYVNDIRESVWRRGDIYATGEWNTGDGNKFWALRVTQSGTLVWGNVYSNVGEMSYGIIDSPFSDVEAVVVGSYPDPTNGSYDGFWMTLNSTTGGTVAVNRIDGGNVDYFRSINRSDEPGNRGFILSGYNDGTASLTKTDNAGNPQWGRKYLPSVHSATHISAFDAKGRLDAMGNYEYYATGPCSDDAFIFKTDQNGTPQNPNAMFFYDTGLEETPNRLDLNNSGINDGVSIYGVVEAFAPAAQREGYIVKAYFNGVTACNENSEDLMDSYAQLNVIPSVIDIEPISTQALSLLSMFNNQDILLCNASSLLAGDNTRMAHVTGIKTQDQVNNGFTLFPNPCNTSAKPLSITVASEKAGAAKITVTDLLGRVVYSQNSQLQPGGNTLELNLTGAPLNNGIYQVSIQTPAGTQTSKFISDNTK